MIALFSSEKNPTKDVDDPYTELLAGTRPMFRAFYSTATAEDSTLLDSVIVASVTLRQATEIPRSEIPPGDRIEVERQTNEVERRFMTACQRVRECATFRKLVPGDQRRISAILFEFKFPTDSV